MIAFVKGIVEDLTEDNVVLDVGGVGYNVKISAGTAALISGVGEELKLYTYTSVREDAFQLFGFLTRDELEIIKKLITVNGIGPKGGLSILSVMSADDIRFAVISGDAKMIAKAPGIGKKTAERVILDLKDKISLEDTLIHKEIAGVGVANVNSSDNKAGNEAVEALTALGYSASDAVRAVKSVPVTEDMDVEDILKQALKNMF